MSADLQTAPSPMETSDMRNDGAASQHVAAEESRFGQVRTAAVPTAGANNTQFTTTAVSREESGANYDSSDLDSSDDDHAEGEVTTAAGAATVASEADAKKKEKEDKKRLEKEEKEKKKKEKAEKKEVKESSTKKAPPMPLEGHHYMVSEAPKPPAPITDDTPDHWYQVHQAKLKETAGAREEERKKELKAKKEETKGSVGYKLGKFFSNTSAAIGGTITGAQESHEVNVRDANIKQARARLAKYFPHEVGTENHFIIEFDCEAMHNNRPFKGHLLLTRNALLFVGKGNSANTTGLVVKEEISLKDIVSYAKGISVPCYEKDKRWVLDVPNNYIKPDAIQIFTSSGKGAMHYNFINITHPLKEFHDGHDEVSYYDRFLNFFDHAWRAAQ